MGGKAFDNTSPVKKEHVDIIAAPIIGKIVQAGADIRVSYLGSTGKKQLSGDIDVGIELNNWSYDMLSDFLKFCLGFTHVQENTSLNQIYTRVKNPEVLHEEWVQVDFIVGDLQLLQFTHYSPYPLEDSLSIDDSFYHSKWSGSHRTELIKAIAKASSWVGYEDGKPVARVGYTLHHNRGLEYDARWHPKRKDGRGRVTKMVGVSDDEVVLFKEQFPQAPDFVRECITNPAEIMKRLFPITSQEQSYLALNTYETIVKCLANEPSLSDKLGLIWELYITRLDHIGKPHPEKSVDEFIQSIHRHKRE